MGGTVNIVDKVMANIFYPLFDDFTFFKLEDNSIFIKDFVYTFKIYQNKSIFVDYIRISSMIPLLPEWTLIP